MSYTTYYLKFADEIEFDSELDTAGFKHTWDAVLDEDGNETEPAGYSYGTSTGAIDVVGTVYRKTGNIINITEQDGTEIDYEETEPVEGFHVNIRLRSGVSMPDNLIPFILDPAPNTPYRVFA